MACDGRRRLFFKFVLGLTVGDDTAAADLGPLPPEGSPVGRVLVHPARPAPVTAAPARSMNSRRSIDTSEQYSPSGDPARWTSVCVARHLPSLAPPSSFATRTSSVNFRDKAVGMSHGPGGGVKMALYRSLHDSYAAVKAMAQLRRSW